MVKYFRDWRKFLSYILLGALSVILLGPVVEDLIQTQPYTNVVIREVEWREEEVVLRATFRKNGDCTIKSFVIVGFADDIPSYVTYENIDHVPGELYNREEGAQGLNILINASDHSHDAFEVRTRHVCTDDKGNEETITKVFTRQEREK